jgi:hypothetical protein
MTEGLRTKGEILFEQYLGSQGLPFEFEKEHAGKSRRPDYTITWEGQTVLFDVKDFDPPEKISMGFQQFDPYTPVREKINQGRDKFKQFKEFCCGLVLHNSRQPFVSLHEPDIMLGAMYGDAGFTFPVDTSTGVGDAKQLKRAFLGRGKMIRPNWLQAQNTTISAIITVVSIKPHFLQLLDLVRENPRRDNEAEIRRRIPEFDPEFGVPHVIVWYNAVARIPFPTTLFRGAYDSHFGIVRVENGEVEQDVTYEGSAVPGRLRLLKLGNANHGK